MNVGKSEDEMLMVRYLLGNSCKGENLHIEERIFADEAFFEQMISIEDDLIFDYVLGYLSEQDCKLFEERFLTLPDRRNRVEIARLLAKAASDTNTQIKPKSRSRSFYRYFIATVTRNHWHA